MTKLSQITPQSLKHTQFIKAPGSKRESTVCCSTGSSVYLVVSNYWTIELHLTPEGPLIRSPLLLLVSFVSHLKFRASAWECKNVTNNIFALHLRERAVEPVGWAFVTRTKQAGIMTAVVVTSLQTNLLDVKCLKKKYLLSLKSL